MYYIAVGVMRLLWELGKGKEQDHQQCGAVTCM